MNDLTIYITLGNQKYLGINDKDELVLFSTKDGIIIDYVVLGRNTRTRVEELKGYLDSLAIHAKG